jgi:taurine dioxygenase
VIFFREVNLSEAEQFALGERFGTPSIFPVARLMGATEPTMTVIEDGPDSDNAADAWHTDVTWTATPPKYALLHMEVVPDRGGDTLWCSATRAYETLSPTMQEFLCGLTVVHDNEGFIESVALKAGDAADSLIEGLRRDYGPVEHPLIRTHPETGRRALFYAARFIRRIKDLTQAESDAILGFLAAHISEPSLHCRWRWSEGDLAIWDERSTLHRAVADHFPQRRIIRRLEIDGDRPYFES